MKLVRIIGLMFAVVVTTALLAACGGDDEKTGDGATATPTETQASCRRKKFSEGWAIVEL